MIIFILGVYTSCSKNNLKITVKTAQNFSGSLYARGYPTECISKGQNRTSTDLILSPQGCGVKILEEEVRNILFFAAIKIIMDHCIMRNTVGK